MVRKERQWRVYDLRSGGERSFYVRAEVAFFRHHHFPLGVALKGGLAVLLSVFIIYGIVEAGPLDAPTSPAASGYTLGDIYSRIASGSTAVAGSHDFAPSATPDSTFYTLTQIYDVLSAIASGSIRNGVTLFGITGAYPSSDHPLPNAGVGIADLAATSSSITSSNGDVEWWQSDGTYASATLDFPALSNVCSSDTSNNSAGTLTVSAGLIGTGNSVCGTSGTLLANLFNGTGQGFTGGSQADGGTDDYNNGGAPATSRYETTWTACDSGNNYCGTGDSGADAKDDATGLIWSMPCKGSGCSSFSESSPSTYSWNNTGGNNNSRTAAQLCSDHAGWYLPHQKQLLQAYIDGAYGNLEGAGGFFNYWAATASSATVNAWHTYISSGYTFSDAKGTATIYVRCVWPSS